MKGKILTTMAAIFFCTMLFATTAHSQVAFQIGLGAGMRMPMGDYSGETTDYYAGTRHGLSTGYSLQAKARVGLPGITLAGGIEYGHLSNSGEGEPGHGNVDVAQSVFTIKAGPEFSFSIPAVPLSPYIGANIAWHSISGTTTFQGLSRVTSETFDVASASRIGFGVNGGLLIKLGAVLTLDLGAEYAFVDPLSKEWSATTKSPQRIDSYRSLNDDKDPLFAPGSDDHFIPTARSISSLQVMATIMFGL